MASMPAVIFLVASITRKLEKETALHVGLNTENKVMVCGVGGADSGA